MTTLSVVSTGPQAYSSTDKTKGVHNICFGVDTGSLRWAYGRNNVTASCPVHGPTCRITRTVNKPPKFKMSGKKLSRKRRSMGRPLGFLASWLKSSWEYSTRSDHMGSVKKNHHDLITRQESRKWLLMYYASCKTLQALFKEERPASKKLDTPDGEPFNFTGCC